MDGLNAVVVQGTDTGEPAEGPGPLPADAVPRASRARWGSPATARPTWRPFRHIDSMQRGDQITLEMPYATFVYRVQKTEIVDPERRRGRRAGRLPAARAQRLPPALQRRAALHRLRPAGPGQPGRRQLAGASSRPPGPTPPPRWSAWSGWSEWSACRSRGRRRRRRGRRVGLVVGAVVVSGSSSRSWWSRWASSAAWSPNRCSGCRCRRVQAITTTAMIEADDHRDQPGDSRRMRRCSAAAGPAASGSPMIRSGPRASALRAEDRIEDLPGVSIPNSFAGALDLLPALAGDRHLHRRDEPRRWRRRRRLKGLRQKKAGLGGALDGFGGPLLSWLGLDWFQVGHPLRRIGFGGLGSSGAGCSKRPHLRLAPSALLDRQLGAVERGDQLVGLVLHRLARWRSRCRSHARSLTAGALRPVIRSDR